MHYIFFIPLKKIIHVIYSCKCHLINVFMLNSQKNQMTYFLHNLNTNYRVNIWGAMHASRHIC